jgi:hypothetical protein
MPSSEIARIIHLAQQTTTFRKFWVRQHGLSLSLKRIPYLTELSDGEKLFAAALRGDFLEVRNLLTNKLSGAKMLEDFTDLAQKTGFSGLLWEWMIDQELVSDFRRHSLLTGISENARFEASLYPNVEQQFCNLLKLCAKHTGHVLWTKGVHLSRTVYAKPYFRQFGDVDVIVHPSELVAFLKTLEEADFYVFKNPAYCNQIGVGPTSHPMDLFIAPSTEWIPTSSLTMHKFGWPIIDIKCGPLDRGLQAVELERFFAEAEERYCLGNRYLGPNTIAHLMILLRNFEKDGFISWKALYDVKLLVDKLNEAPLDWAEFVSQCSNEAIRTSAWMGLSIARDRLNSMVPDFVLSDLEPTNKLVSQYFSFTLGTSFVWNSSSLPMLIMNALTSDDRERKLRVLGKSFVPSRSFLSKYYGRNCQFGPATHFTWLLLHWITLLLPAGAIRQSIGKVIWSQKL